MRNHDRNQSTPEETRRAVIAALKERVHVGDTLAPGALLVIARLEAEAARDAATIVELRASLRKSLS